MKKWKPAPREAVAAFEAATSELPGAEPRKMFGYSCVFAKGNMFAGLHEAGMVLRLADEQRAEFLRLKGAEQFEPMPGRVMREYVVVPRVLLNAPDQLREWVEKSLAYVSSLPAKGKKGSGPSKSSKSPKKRGLGARSKKSRQGKSMEKILIKKLKSLSNPEAVAGMARFGINPKNTYGVSIPVLRKMAMEIGQNHLLAQRLWNSGVHEARILAGMIDLPEEITEKQMERWVRDFDSWDVCDQVCSNLFDRTQFAHKKAMNWSKRGEEFVKRAGFVLMAALSVHDKKAGDKKFLKFLPIIKREARDERNFVKKAVNWALRQIGKRDLHLNQKAIKTAKEIQGIESKAAKWIASDAIRELTSQVVQKRLRMR
jgi:3-methyladenine DNA glycosylase AlkD/TfoX/Sxy family transcriptional regulator of competence genes